MRGLFGKSKERKEEKLGDRDAKARGNGKPTLSGKHFDGSRPMDSLTFRTQSSPSPRDNLDGCRLNDASGSEQPTLYSNLPTRRRTYDSTANELPMKNPFYQARQLDFEEVIEAEPTSASGPSSQRSIAKRMPEFSEMDVSNISSRTRTPGSSTQPSTVCNIRVSGRLTEFSAEVNAPSPPQRPELPVQSTNMRISGRLPEFITPRGASRETLGSEMSTPRSSGVRVFSRMPEFHSATQELQQMIDMRRSEREAAAEQERESITGASSRNASRMSSRRGSARSDSGERHASTGRPVARIPERLPSFADEKHQEISMIKSPKQVSGRLPEFMAGEAAGEKTKTPAVVEERSRDRTNLASRSKRGASIDPPVRKRSANKIRSMSGRLSDLNAEKISDNANTLGGKSLVSRVSGRLPDFDLGDVTTERNCKSAQSSITESDNTLQDTPIGIPRLSGRLVSFNPTK